MFFRLYRPCWFSVGWFILCRKSYPSTLVPKLHLGTHLSAQFHCLLQPFQSCLRRAQKCGKSSFWLFNFHRYDVSRNKLLRFDCCMSIGKPFGPMEFKNAVLAKTIKFSLDRPLLAVNCVHIKGCRVHDSKTFVAFSRIPSFKSVFPSFPNSIWERNCPRNSIARFNPYRVGAAGTAYPG